MASDTSGGVSHPGLMLGECMKLSAWAKANGGSRQVSGQTAHRSFHAGVLRVGAHPPATGTILVQEPGRASARTAMYDRMSCVTRERTWIVRSLGSSRMRGALVWYRPGWSPRAARV
jgi:hypothetical protein